MATEYGWKILLDDVDITDKVVSFSISSSLSSFCRELSFNLIDDGLFDTFDFSNIPETTRVDIFTRILDVDEYDLPEENWISQGSYYIEKPSYQVGVQSTSTGVWGRQSTAILGEPFAQKVTKAWDADTTFFLIADEILDLAGLAWSDARCEINDFTVYADTFSVDNVYPIDVLRSLVDLSVGQEGFIVSDRLGNIWVKALDRNPDEYDYNLTDLVIQSIKDDPEWPGFANRVKISATDVAEPYVIQKLYTVLTEIAPVIDDMTLENWNISPNKTYFARIERTE